MVKISNFSSVLEVSIALHLAYSLLRSIHNEPIIFIESQLDRIKSEFQTIKTEFDITKEDSSHLNNLLFSAELSLIMKLKRYEIMISKFVKWSSLVATCSTLLLISTGFFPDLEITSISMVAVLGLLLLPMPVFVLITRLIIRSKSNKVEKKLWRANDELYSLWEKYDNTKQNNA